MTTVPAALSAIVDAARQTLPDARVEDGPWTVRPTESDVMAIGLEEPDVARGVEFTADPAGLDSDQESYTVLGLASSCSGDTDMAATRLQCDAMLETLRAALRADPTLGGVVMQARLRALTFDQYQTSQGTEVAALFGIRVVAFRTD